MEQEPEERTVQPTKPKRCLELLGVHLLNHLANS